MAIDILKLLIKNKLRQYIRSFKKKKLKWILCIFLCVFLLFNLFSGTNLIKMAVTKYFSVLSLAFFIYCIAKIFQNIPIMNIDCKLLDFKVLKFWQLKMIIILKSVVLSGFIVICILLFPNIVSKVLLHKIIVLILINIVINIICFLKSQTNYTNILTIGTLLIISSAYYFDSIALIAVYLLIAIYVFSSKKYFKYDDLLSYYHSMALLHQGLVNSKMDDLSRGQVQFTKQKIKSSFNFMEKYFDNDYWFGFYKEISRVLYNYKKIINASIINFLMILLVLMYEHPIWINGVAMLGLTFISDMVLTSLNEPEAVNISKGFYYPYSLSDIIKQKYFVHLCIISIPFLSGILIVKYVSFIILITCFLILPLKNILQSFSSKFVVKCVAYCLEGIISLLCFINVI